MDKLIVNNDRRSKIVDERKVEFQKRGMKREEAFRKILRLSHVSSLHHGRRRMSAPDWLDQHPFPLVIGRWNSRGSL